MASVDSPALSQGVGGVYGLVRRICRGHRDHVTSVSMRDVRDWMREIMRRRSRRGPNESESTGKSGQELPSNQQAPLRPNYPEPLPVATPEPTEAVGKDAPAEKVDQPMKPVR